MALKEAVLGLLYDSPKTGYEIKKFYSETIHNFWNVSDGQLYPTLRKMDDEGLVSKTVVPQDNTANKNVYSITDKGKSAFMEWLKEPIHKFQEMKEPFLIKMFFFDKLSKDDILNHFRTQFGVHQKMIEEFRNVEITYRETLTDYQKLIAEVGLIFMDFRMLWITRLMQLLQGDNVDGKHRIIPEDMRDAVLSFFLAIFSEERDPKLNEFLDWLRSMGAGANAALASSAQ